MSCNVFWQKCSAQVSAKLFSHQMWRIKLDPIGRNVKRHVFLGGGGFLMGWGSQKNEKRINKIKRSKFAHSFKGTVCNLPYVAHAVRIFSSALLTYGLCIFRI